MEVKIRKRGSRNGNWKSGNIKGSGNCRKWKYKWKRGIVKSENGNCQKWKQKNCVNRNWKRRIRNRCGNRNWKNGTENQKMWRQKWKLENVKVEMNMGIVKRGSINESGY